MREIGRIVDLRWRPGSEERRSVTIQAEDTAPRQSSAVEPSKPRLLNVLGPGLVTGASDDDPSGIATYSQAGAQFGYAISWTMLFSYPLMTVIQEISARVGRTTGHGIAGNLSRHYPTWLVAIVVPLLFIANTINIGADLGAMADVMTLLLGGPHLAYVVLLGAACVGMQVFMQYKRYVSALKWLTLSLFTYFATVAVVHVPWGEALSGLLIPRFKSDADFWTTVVAILGTTISPYLFFWQAAQEVEDQKIRPHREPLIEAPEQASGAIRRIRLDTFVGMGFSNLVALAIILTAAATLHAKGITTVETSAQAAAALEPIAGRLAFAIFGIGILGTGLLAIPVLAGSAAYAVAEAFRWPIGLARQPLEARAFYITLALATGLGAAINLLNINPIRALYWTAVINGVLAPPIMALMMHMTADRRIMGPFTVEGPLRVIGWIATVVMMLAALLFLGLSFV
jgi:NRAMP (natural resistance-associated macrophage protein)-like metal ion transporter